MAAAVTFIVLLWLAFLVMRTLATWASSKGSALRNTVALLLAAGSSYAVGFVLHLWVEATAGEIPIANVIAPSVMWLFLAAACMVSAIRTVTVPLVLSMPFALNALLALVATGVQSRHIFVALPLAVIAALPFAAGQLLPSPASAAQLTTGMVTSLGGFHLAQPVSAALDLKEFSAAKYAAFRAAGWQPLRSDERLYDAKDVNFQGSEWTVTIGVVVGKIYKIHLNNLSEDKPASDRAFAKVLQYLQSQMGKYTEHTATPDVYIWDRVEGNTILEQRAALGYWGINVFLTSGFIKDLQ